MTDEVREVGPPRPARECDVEALIEVIAAVAPEGSIGAEPPVDRDVFRERFRGAVAAKAPAGIWVVESGGAVVGYAGLYAGGPAGVLGLGMAIRREGRARGAGRALLTTAVAYAREHGAHRVELEVWPDNGRAIALYSSAGFEVEGVRRERYRRRDGSLRSAVMMALRT